MTPKEKAKELFHKFYNAIPSDEIGENYNSAKQCALIAVDEMEEVYASAVSAILNSKEKAELFKSRFLQEVKQEIEKL
jgi:hypothetical protein